MASRKKTTPDEVFVPRQIDRHATEVSPGLVRIEGLDTLQPLGQYLERQAEHLSYLRSREKSLYCECRGFININLTLRDGQWQETCRKLSWALTLSGNQEHLRQIVCLCPKMALGMPQESQVQYHHLSHFVKAFLATILQLAPVPQGHSSCLVNAAQDEEEALQSRVIVWEYLLSLVPAERKLPQEKKMTEVQILLKQQQQILQLIEQTNQNLNLLMEVLQCQSKQAKATQAERPDTTTL